MTLNGWRCRSLALFAFLVGIPSAARAQAATSSALPIRFSGEVRQRSDWDEPTGTSADLITYLRSRLGVAVAPSPTLSFFVQVQDSRVYGAESNSSASAPDLFDLHQAYLQLNGTRGANALSLRAGRQEIAFGNERLVGASNWTNTGRSFDGASFSVAPRSQGAAPAAAAQRWTASAFAATIDERGRRVGVTGAAGNRNDHQTLGALAARDLTQAARLEGTLLYDVGAQYRTFDQSNRATADVRLRALPVAAPYWELEGAYQAGTQRFVPAAGLPSSQQVGAWLMGVRLGTSRAPSHATSATLGLDVLSGDATPTNGHYSAFNTMFGTNHPFYGLMDLFTDPAARTNDRGLVDAFAMSNWRLAPGYALHGELHRFAAADQPASIPAGPLGWELDLGLPYAIAPAVSLETGYSLFRAGAGAAGLTLGSTGQLHHWLYVQLRAGF